MIRLEHIAPGTLLLPATFNITHFPELVGATVLSVLKDGIGYTKILVTNDFEAPMPTGKHARFNPTLGTIALPTLFEPGEVMVILYQPDPTPCAAPVINPQTLLAAIPNLAYSATISLSGFTPFTLSSVVKPSWMNIAVSGSYVQITGTPSIGDVGSAIPVSFTVNNSCGSDDYASIIYVTLTAVYVSSFVIDRLTVNRSTQVMTGYLSGTPATTVTMKLSTFTNTNGGVIKVNGVNSSLGDTWPIVLDNMGNGSLLTEIDGLSNLGTKMICVFTIFSVSAGSIGSPNYFTNSKIF